MSDRHAAIVKITTAALAQFLRLPKGSTIQFVHQSPDNQFAGTVQLLIEHPDLPEVGEGEIPRDIDLLYTKRHTRATFGDKHP